MYQGCHRIFSTKFPEFPGVFSGGFDHFPQVNRTQNPYYDIPRHLPDKLAHDFHDFWTFDQ